jgi:Gpi18-like mannosyltransferase
MLSRLKFKELWEKIRKHDWEYISYFVFASILALLIRIPLLSFKSGDFFAYTKAWYIAIQTSGFSALKDNISNYNPPYLYLLYLVVQFLPGLEKVIAIKIPSLIFDFICAGFIYKIVRIKYENRIVGLLAYTAVLLSPTMILNSSFWGQADSIYTAGIIASVYFLITRKNWYSFISFGIAFAFKLQAIFLLPLLIAFWLKKELSWKHFLAIPIVYFIAILPAWLVGRPLPSLLSIYFTQTGEYNGLTSHAPSLYAWFPLKPEIYPLITSAGIIFAITVILIFILIVIKSLVKLTPTLILDLAFLAVLLIPFVLPKMHQRYFFPADILSIAFGFYFPTYFYVPLAVTLVSFFSYQYFLFGVEPIPNSNLALVILTIIAILVSKVLRDLFDTKNEVKEDETRK